MLARSWASGSLPESGSIVPETPAIQGQTSALPVELATGKFAKIANSGGVEVFGRVPCFATGDAAQRPDAPGRDITAAKARPAAIDDIWDETSTPFLTRSRLVNASACIRYTRA